jgi:hypothetical protein
MSDFDERENPAAATDAKKAVMDGDEDFHALHRLITGTKVNDADVAELRTVINDHNRKRLHAALDRVLDRLRQKRCGGDREFLRRAGVRP